MLLRRRMMMQTEKSGAKYPLVNGRHEFSNGGYVEVTNGNHFAYRKSEVGSAFINISNIFQNGDLQSSVSNINYLPEIYTIPSGVPIRFEIKNVNGWGNYYGETNFRLANAPASGSFKAGAFTNNNPNNNTILEKILDSPEKVGCLFLYSTMILDCRIEFDVEFTVNGERWI